MKAKLILFDFDGTLVDSKAIFFELYNELATQKGYKLLDSENIHYLRSLSIKERCHYLGIPLYKIPFIANTLIKKFHASVGRLQCNEGMKPLLNTLDTEGYAYCIVSTNAKKNIKSFFEMQGVAIPEIYTSSKVFGKDVLLRKLLKDKNLQWEEVIYIGDEARDIVACRKCNIPVVWVSWGYDSAEAITQTPPDYTANTPAELQELIKQLVSVQG
ncbi:HAD hydrolase-like protein [Flavobacterium salilacus subsp. salilacus]|uniref:HAD hydrolase-like protein n=1 Tax=Flavobacterium TaxID=237 RepID=UPI00107551A8|nr:MULTISPECIES: HAD hydrolase-like protein [Flavobacterium]KAF2518191.1 HAD hydrolase-like protein [Flavobacterium salilacus subsp. salilacus]MBE1615496.1 HAD hydrolase-like protein [Flavobacterium sp. SaA2.13]